MNQTATLVWFFSLTYLVTWALFFAAIALPHGSPETDESFTAIRSALLFTGTIAPALLALAMSGKQRLLEGRFQWQVSIRFYFFALFYMAAIKFVVALTYRIITGSWLQFAPWSLGEVVVAITISTPIQAGEEIGWRGYALPRLADRFGIALGSILLGFIWACWHLPLFFLKVPGNDEYGQSFPVWALGVTGLSVAIAWLYAHTGGSLLLTMLMHSAVNNIPHFASSPAATAKDVFSLNASLISWLTAIVLSLAAACMLPGLRQTCRLTLR